MTDVIFIGKMFYSDLSIGGGPIYPTQPPQPPLGIWGPPQMPPGIWPSPPGQRPPSGPVDPGYSPPWARPPVDPGWGVGPPQPPVIAGGPGWLPQPPGQPPVIAGGPGSLPPFVMPPIYIPGQPVLPDAGDPTKAHLVVYVPGKGAISFTVDLTNLPEPVPPTEATPKPA